MIIGGNLTNHRTKPDVIKGINFYADKLGITKELPDINKLDWNKLRNLETLLWGKCKTAGLLD